MMKKASRFFPDDLRRALNEGTTLTVRAILSLCALAQSAAHFLGAPSFMNSPAYSAMNAVIPVTYWGCAFGTIGILGWWRVWSNESKPLAAWVTNILTLLVWSLGLVARLKMGTLSLVSVYTVITLAAFWCLLRTEATDRDTRTA